MKASEIRKEARIALGGKWKKAACIALVYLALSIIIGFIEGLVGEGTIIYNLIEIVYFIISVPLSFGLIISFIKLKRGEEISAFDFFNEGFSKFGKSWGIWFYNLLKLLLPTICFAFATVFMLTVGIISAAAGANNLLALLSVIIFIATLVWLVCKSFLYTLAYYISYDNPELSSKECINKSAQLMKGNRIKYFCLDFSFIGWILLLLVIFVLLTALLTVLLTYGGSLIASLLSIIGMLFLMPYMQVALVCFYERLVNPETKNNEEVINTKK